MNKKNSGFTIIELLVVVVIMVIIGVIFTDILVETLRGRNKVNVINQVKQNGQVILDKLSNEIRGAEGIVCVGKSTVGNINPSSIALDTIVIFNSGTYSQFRLFPPFPIISPTKNGYIQKVNFTRTRNDIAYGFTDQQLCTTLNITTLDLNLMQSLTDTDSKNGVSVDITPGQNVNVFEQKGDNIIIRFNASAGVSAGYAYDVTVKDGGVSFMTSVQVRGIKR